MLIRQARSVIQAALHAIDTTSGELAYLTSPLSWRTGMIALLACLVGGVQAVFSPNSVPAALELGMFALYALSCFTLGLFLYASKPRLMLAAVAAGMLLGLALSLGPTPLLGAKLVASAVTFLVLAVVVPSAIFYILCVPMWGRTPDLAAYAGALPALALYLLFYIALTLLLGTFLNARGGVAAIASVVAFSGSFIGSVLPTGAEMTPWGLPRLALAMATAQPLPGNWAIALASTVIVIVLCASATIWRIAREEF